MKSIPFTRLKISEKYFFSTMVFLLTIVAVGLGSAYYIDQEGHIVTGMDNQIVWGIPHIFAVSLILGSSGTLNIATIGSLFGQSEYTSFGRLSGLLTIGLLIGGLSILVLDLGRPDRLIIAITHYNFKSIFAWNIFLYSGFLIIVGLYLWTMMERTADHLTKPVALLALIWRLALTTGTGLIFGLLVAREAYDAAIMAPLFIAISLVFGLAIFILVIAYIQMVAEITFQEVIWLRARKMFYIFIALNAYFTTIQHLTTLYASEHGAMESFILVDGGAISILFWLGQMGIGIFLPLILLFFAANTQLIWRLIMASILAVFGSFIQIYVIIIGGQSFPLVLFPGMEISSSFSDGTIDPYIPSLVEFGLGLEGCAISVIIIFLGLRLLEFIPTNHKN